MSPNRILPPPDDNDEDIFDQNGGQEEEEEIIGMNYVKSGFLASLIISNGSKD